MRKQFNYGHMLCVYVILFCLIFLVVCMHVYSLNGYSVCVCCKFVRILKRYVEECGNGLSINYKSNQTKNSLACGYRVQINLT